MTFLQRFALLGSLIATAAQAVPPDGQLDTSFGTGGKVKLAFDKAGSSKVDIGNKVITTTDYSYVFGTVARSDGDVSTITRFRKNGTVDLLYGTQGTLYFDLMHLDGLFDSYYVINGTLQQDGKLVAVGQATLADDTFMLVCRFMTNGQLDTSFGPDEGCSHFNFGASQNSAYDVAIQGEKFLIAAGSFYNNAWQGYIARLDATGKIDSSFGDPMLFTPGYRDLGLYVQPRKIFVYPNGRFLVGVLRSGDECNSSYGSTGNAVSLTKFLSNGTTDTAFKGGEAYIDFTFGYDFVNAQEIDCTISQDDLIDFSVASDGSIFVGMRAEIPGPMTFTAMVTKLNADGSFDSNFGVPVGLLADMGQTAVRIDACPGCGSSNFTGFARLPNGRMVFSGSTIAPGTTAPDMLALRLLPDGSIDPRFGNDVLGVPGRTVIGFDTMPNTTYDLGRSLAIQDGKPLIVGITTTLSPVNTDFALVRLSDDTIFADGFEY